MCFLIVITIIIIYVTNACAIMHPISHKFGQFFLQPPVNIEIRVCFIRVGDDLK